MNYESRRILPPVSSRKRKERESLLAAPEVIPATKPSAPPAQSDARPPSDNRLLAGYMAYELLTKGTLLGQRFDPARAEAAPVGPSGAGAATPKRTKTEGEVSAGKERGSYADVATILKTEGAHIPGIVNPTQLARWIRM